jgi:hypothetical protein
MMNDELDVITDEWMAWRTVCDLLRARGIDVNEATHEPLVRAMRHHARAYRELYAGPIIRHVEADADAQATRNHYGALST